MNDIELKEKFITLRAEGVSFDNIAKELKKSKTTLIEWQREFKKDINNLQYFNIQNLIEKYQVTKKRKLEFYSKQLDKIYKAFEQKNYNDVSIKELNDLRTKFECDLEKEKSKISFDTGIEEYDPLYLDNRKVILPL